VTEERCVVRETKSLGVCQRCGHSIWPSPSEMEGFPTEWVCECKEPVFEKHTEGPPPPVPVYYCC